MTSIFEKFIRFGEFTTRAIQRRLPLVVTLRGSRDIWGGAKMAPPPTGRVGRQSPTGRGAALFKLRSELKRPHFALMRRACTLNERRRGTSWAHDYHSQCEHGNVPSTNGNAARPRAKSFLWQWSHALDHLRKFPFTMRKWQTTDLLTNGKTIVPIHYGENGKPDYQWKITNYAVSASSTWRYTASRSCTDEIRSDPAWRGCHPLND